MTIRHLTFDADPLPYTQGVIAAADPVNRALEMQIDKGFDDLDCADLQATSELRLCDSPYSSDAWSEEQYFPKLENRVRLGPGHWRLTTAAKDYRFDASLVGKKWMLWTNGTTAGRSAFRTARTVCWMTCESTWRAAAASI